MAIISDSGYATAKATGVVSEWQKLSLASQVAGTLVSLWRASGYPTPGAIPGASALCDASTLGGLEQPALVGGNTRYIDELDNVGTVASSVLVWDRVLASGNLNGTLTTLQSIAQPALPARAPASNALRWFLEIYTALGATAATATVNLTYTDAFSDTVTVAIPASIAAGRLLSIFASAASQAAGRIIASVTGVTLSVSTGTAGAFGVTCYRSLGLTHKTTLANVGEPRQLALIAPIANDACLVPIVRTTATSSGDQTGTVRLIQG